MSEKHLTDLEIAKLELSQKDQLLKKLEQIILERDAAIIKHQQEQLKLKIGMLDFEQYKLQHKISQKGEQKQKLMDEAKKLHKEIEEKHELTPGWGYNPDTNEIILKED